MIGVVVGQQDVGDAPAQRLGGGQMGRGAGDIYTGDALTAPDHPAVIIQQIGKAVAQHRDYYQPVQRGIAAVQFQMGGHLCHLPCLRSAFWTSLPLPSALARKFGAVLRVGATYSPERASGTRPPTLRTLPLSHA